MTAGQHIDYERLAQDAMRGLVKTVLELVAKSGLNGDHHFYIAFNTQAPGVSVSKRLKEKYPVEMTIVLQHRFWNLEVGEDKFEVKLTFDGIPERLVIPYRAVKVFYDPSVPYGLQFEESELTAGQPRSPGLVRSTDESGERSAYLRPRPNGEGQPANAAGEKRRERTVRKSRSDKVGDNSLPAPSVPVNLRAPPSGNGTEKRSAETRLQPVLPDGRGKAASPKSDPEKPEQPPKSGGEGAKVVDFSAFRNKKT